MEGLIAVIVTAVVATGAIWWIRHGVSASRHGEMRLRRICLGDDRQVEQLIASEMTRTPGITRAEASRRAVLRYERDNR